MPYNKGTQCVGEDRSIYRRGARRWRKIYLVNGHKYQAKRFARTALCKVCQDRIWGLGRQGYKCLECKIMVHKRCHKFITLECNEIVNQQQQHQHNHVPIIVDNNNSGDVNRARMPNAKTIASISTIDTDNTANKKEFDSRLDTVYNINTFFVESKSKILMASFTVIKYNYLFELIWINVA